MMGLTRYPACFFLILLLMENSKAAPSARTTSLEEASLQLGALQSQAQYPPAALQGARAAAASRSAASCLVTAVQYTHGQQIWRADPCEFCLCLDGEMFCWWQECPPAAPGPCPGPQPFSLCGNFSGAFEKRPTPAPKKNKKPSKKVSYTATKKTKKQTTKSNTKPLITTAQNTTAGKQMNNATLNNTNNAKINQTNTLPTLKSKNVQKEQKQQPFYSSIGMDFNYTNEDLSKRDNTDTALNGKSDLSESAQDRSWLIENEDTNENEQNNRNTEASSDASKTRCIVMGKEYHIGEMLPSTGSCLTCHCTKGNGKDSPAKVTCAPRGCAPLDPIAQDDTEIL